MMTQFKSPLFVKINDQTVEKGALNVLENTNHKKTKNDQLQNIKRKNLSLKYTNLSKNRF